MVQALFPDPGHDGEEPGRSPLPPEDGEGMGQWLYVCVPAGQVTLAGFAQGGEAGTTGPGPLLATIVDTVTGPDGGGLGGCSDDQLLGIISAARRQAAGDEWVQLAAIAEFAARHDGSRPADEFAPDELAFELHLTAASAAGQLAYAATVAARLPQTFAALGAGTIHPVHLRIIEDETSILSDEDAAIADAVLARQAPGLTLDLRDAGLRDAHRHSDLSLRKPGVLPQLGELVTALLGSQRGAAALALSRPLRSVPVRVQLTDLTLGVLPPDRLHSSSLRISCR